MLYQIIISGYSKLGQFTSSVCEQKEFKNLPEAKEHARVMWKEFGDESKLPFLQLFISDIEKQKTVFYAANFK